MPTLDQWEQALTSPREVQVESSASLVAEVQQRNTAFDAKRAAKGQPISPRKNNLSTVPPFSPERAIQVVPAYLLHRLGVVTTPPIENLADICSTWAYLRYLWAFDLGEANSPLRLSEAARNIDFHQKGLLSDQIGVGMAALLLGTFLNAPLAADVSVALGDPAWAIDLQYETSPDYLFFDAAQSELFVVECKGTGSSRSECIHQLRRGTEQVPSVTFTDRRTPPAIVIATCLSRRGTRVLLIDPPGEENPTKKPEQPERIGKREWKVKNDAEFTRVTRLLSEAKVLSFAGADLAAASKLERVHTKRRNTPISTPRDSEISENEFGVFKGVRQRVGLRDRFNIDLFQALDTNVFDALLSEEPARTQEELRIFQARTNTASGHSRQDHGSGDLAESERTQSVLTTRERGAVVVRSAGPDGSLLEVRVSPP